MLYRKKHRNLSCRPRPRPISEEEPVSEPVSEEEPTTTCWWNMGHGVPPALEEICGKRTERAWEQGSMLLLLLEGDRVAMFELYRTDSSKHPTVIQVSIGDALSGFVTKADRSMPQTARTLALRGKRVTGLDGDVLVFEKIFGVEFTPDRLNYVLAAGAVDAVDREELDS